MPRIVFVTFRPKTRLLKPTEAIPAQKQGARSNVKFGISVNSEKEAADHYEKARKNLLEINRWQEMAGKLSAAFVLTDPHGMPAQRLPLQGDYIRIHLPTAADTKFEWVRIEAIEEQRPNEQSAWIMIRVRPSDPPRKQEETEHFFSKEATSSFYIERKGRKIVASVQGRNELPNLHAPDAGSTIRNLLISLGAMLGLNYPQWKGLVKGLLNA